MWKCLTSIWSKYNPFDIDVHLKTMMVAFDEISERLTNVENAIDKEMIMIRSELEMYKSFLYTLGDTIPDMMWVKDLDGKYLYANEAIKEGLLFNRNPLGKTDIEMANIAKVRFGCDNHTFGEKCSNSDKIVIERVLDGTFKREDGRFLESGKIRGKDTYLEVWKAPMYIEGTLIGICGTGRDITEYVTAYRKNDCAKCPTSIDIFKKYEFEE